MRDEHEALAASLFHSAGVWERLAGAGCFTECPEVTVEVVLASNTKGEMRDGGKKRFTWKPAPDQFESDGQNVSAAKAGALSHAPALIAQPVKSVLAHLLTHRDAGLLTSADLPSLFHAEAGCFLSGSTFTGSARHRPLRPRYSLLRRRRCARSGQSLRRGVPELPRHWD